MIEEFKTYTLKEVAEITGYNIHTLKRRIASGDLKRVSKPTERIRVLGVELKKFLKVK